MCPSWEEPWGDLLRLIIRCISHWSLVDFLVFCSSNTWEAASLITFALEESVSCFHQLYTPALSQWVPEESQDASPWGTHSSRYSARAMWATLWVRGIETNIKCLLFARHSASGCFTHTLFTRSLYCSFCRGRNRKAELLTQSYMVSQEEVEPGSEFHSSSRKNLQSLSQTPRGRLSAESDILSHIYSCAGSSLL